MNSTNVLGYYSFVGARLAIAVAVLVSAGHSGSAGAQEVASLANPLFLPAVSYHTGGSEAGFVAVADVNGDGFPDLLVANTYYSNTVSVFLGKGDGTFWGVVKNASGGGYPSSIVAIDLNGDHKLDLVVLNQAPCYACSGDGVVAILLGKGNGTFTVTATYDSGGQGTVGPAPGGLAVADVNGDGKPDIVVMNCAASDSSGCGHGEGAVGVLLGNGNGTFQPVVSYPSGSAPGGISLAITDANGDGKPDVIVTNGCVTTSDCSTGGIGVLLGNGDGTFKSSVEYPVAEFGPGQVAVADLNGDGKPDVVVAGCGNSSCSVPGGVSVLLGNGNGTFQPAVAYDAGNPHPYGLVVSDIDGDGKMDVLAAGVPADLAIVLLGDGRGDLLAPLTFPSGSRSVAYSVAASDIDGDGKPDALVTSCASGSPCGGNISGAVGVLLSYGTVSQTTLTTSASPSLVGQAVTFTATVTSNSGSSQARGLVAFYDGTNGKLATKVLASGIATFSTSSLKAGRHRIEALYLGNTSFKRSSAVVIQVVQK